MVKKLCMLLFALVLILSACGRPTEDNDTYTIRVAYLVSETQSTHLIAEQFKEQVEDESEGRISVELYPNGSLFPSDREAVESVQLGNVEMTIPALATVSSFDKNFMLLDLPFLFDSHEEAYQVLDGEFGQGLLQELEDYNLKGLTFAENGFRHITNNEHPIEEMSDLDGQKFRTLESPVQTDVFNAFGANASPFAFGEMYSALQQGVYDSMEGPVALLYTSNIQEVQDYMTLSNHIYMPTALLMNNEFFEDLPEDLQEVVQEASYMYRDEQRQLAQEQDEEWIQTLQDDGMEINELSDEAQEEFQEAAQPVYDKYEAQLGSDLFEAFYKARDE
jgi:C4-dicarboxylate-binding protein DctP